MINRDQRVRLAAFDWLEHQRQLHGDTLERSRLLAGFTFEGVRVPLVSAQQGIFKPAILDLPLSITTTPPSDRKPRLYDDEFDPSGLLQYRYRGQDPTHRDNAGLREAMQRQLPLIYFHGIVPGRYKASWPIFIVSDDPHTLTFTVAVDDRRLALTPQVLDTPEVEIRRRYVTRQVKQRLTSRRSGSACWTLTASTARFVVYATTSF
jgi:putative restriction endonuclease